MMTDMPSASGEKLSISRVGRPASGGFLMIEGTFCTFSDADLELVEPRQLELAHAEIADAGAQDVDDRTDAHPRRGLARDDRLLRSGVEDEVHLRAAVDARLDDDLFVEHAERHRVELAGRRRVDVQGRPRSECAEETHLGARPRGFRAAILVRQQVDIARVRVRRFLVPPHLLVDRSDGVMELGITRVLVQRRLRCRQRLVQLVACGKAAREAVEGAALSC